MLNEDKIKLMADIAAFEKRGGKKIEPAYRYFKGDYISNHLFRSFLSYLICFLLGTVVWPFYSFGGLTDITDTAHLVSIAGHYIIFFIAGLVIYLLLSAVIYTRRYDYAVREMKVYVAKLKRLDKRYEFQAKAKDIVRESKGGRYR